jgi:redox-sensitive bicupin YhaK (pirin superfamily)
MSTQQNANIRVRKSSARGHADHGWLNTYHTFSFADYYDPAHMGFRSLRVINDDTVAPGSGFGTHPHQDMEIISYVVQGALEHRDSMGNGSVIEAGHVQRMSAGTGILHSEFNPSQKEPVHFYQIWIEPKQYGLEPSYEETRVGDIKSQGGLKLLAGPEKHLGNVNIHQDALLYLGQLQKGEVLSHQTLQKRGIWIHVIDGHITVAGEPLAKGDSIRIENIAPINLAAQSTVEFLLFDLK